MTSPTQRRCTSGERRDTCIPSKVGTRPLPLHRLRGIIMAHAARAGRRAWLASWLVSRILYYGAGRELAWIYHIVVHTIIRPLTLQDARVDCHTLPQQAHTYRPRSPYASSPVALISTAKPDASVTSPQTCAHRNGSGVSIRWKGGRKRGLRTTTQSSPASVGEHSLA